MDVSSGATPFHVFGFVYIYDTTLFLDGDIRQEEQRGTAFYDTLNGLSWALSPLIGIIRIIATAIIKKNTTSLVNTFWNTQYARGVMEIFGAGPILMIVDLIFTALRYIPKEALV